MKSSGLDTSSNLVWWPERGMGFHPEPPMDYTGDYWENYRNLDDSPMGKALTQERVRMVRRHVDPVSVIDIGIGGGRFVEAAGCDGYDVNPIATEWLGNRGALRDPYDGCAHISCWDSLEHIPNPKELVDCVSGYVFVSMPIYESGEAVLKSRHFKPGEHLWYWTHRGLINWFDAMGFDCVEHNTNESLLGREGIGSYAFVRRRQNPE